MKIQICGSMTFAKEMMEAKRQLEKMGHIADVPCDTDLHVDDNTFIDNFETNYKHCLENNVIKKCFDLLAESDAILVLNPEKNGIKGYIGTSTLMEIGLAFYLGKKIFIFNETPSVNEHRWVHEIKIMQAEIINGDLGKIK